MLSAAKAFLDQHRKNGTAVTTRFDLVTIPVIEQEERVALTTPKGQFIVLVSAVKAAIGLMLALCLSMLTKERYPFDLRNVLAVLREGNKEKVSIPTQLRGEAVWSRIDNVDEMWHPC